MVDDPPGCPVFVARTVSGFDPAAPTPDWMSRRLQLAGMRPISLAVDVTNYVMLELGHPIHGYDADRLAGPIRVRRATEGEHLTTLDGVDRVLSAEDLRGHRRLRTDRPRRGDGRRDHRDVRDHDPGAGRGGPLGPGLDVPHRQAPQADLARRASATSAASTRRSPRRPPIGWSSCSSRTAAARPMPASPRSARHRRCPAIRIPADLPARVTGMPIDEATVVTCLEAVGCRCVGRPVTGTRTGRRSAAVAPRPHRPLRPGRGGRPGRRLRPGALGAAAGAGRARADAGPTAAPPGRPHPGRRRVRRGAHLPVRRERGVRRARARADDPRRTALRAGQPAVQRGAADDDHAAAGSARDRGAQPRPRHRRPGPVRDRDGDPSASRRRRPDPSRRPPTHRRRVGRPAEGAARPAPPPGAGAGRRPGAGRLVGRGPSGDLERCGGGQSARSPRRSA